MGDIPPNLKISPIAMILYNSWKYRAILDLSFQLKILGLRMLSVNGATTQTAPQHSMNELGQAIQRLVALMAAAPTDFPAFLFSKLDIKDGFWRIQVGEEDKWNFAYILPPADPHKLVKLEDIEIVFPRTLQMGWTESSYFFCAGTETARDMADDLIVTDTEVPVYPLEHLSTPPDKWADDPALAPTGDTFIKQLEVYVDDSCT